MNDLHDDWVVQVNQQPREKHMYNTDEFYHIRDLLKQHQIRVTIPRVVIYRILKRASNVMTASEIKTQAIHDDQLIQLATIYSTLRIFEQQKLLQ